MKKSKGKILYTGVLFAAALGFATGGLSKTVANASPSSLGLQLVSPFSYEEYLSLESPTDVSISEERTAIADGNVIYLYDVDKQEYSAYEHTERVENLEIADENLYFRDGDDRLHRISLSDPTQPLFAEDLSFTCRTFIIGGKDLYCRIGNSKIEKYQLSTLTKESVVEEMADEFTPLAFWNGTLCYFKNNQLYQNNGGQAIASFPYQVSSMAITGDILSLTANGNLYAYNLNELNGTDNAENSQLLMEETGNYKSVSSFGDKVYATDLEKRSVKKFKKTSDGFQEDGEICNVSASLNRLSDATALTLSGGKLLIADNGNDRISIYDTATGEYLPALPAAFTPNRIASHGETVLLAEDSSAVLYSLNQENYASPLLTLDSVHGQIVGITAVYEKYYVLTNTNHCYLFKKSETDWTVEEYERKSTSAKAIASDVYGYLYVVSETGVYRYSEEAFLDPNGKGELLFETLPTEIKEIAVDYGQNIYLLTETALYQFETDGYTQKEYSFERLVYGKTPVALSLALSAENNGAYLLFEGNYLAQTNALNLPSASALPTGDSYAQIHEENAPTQLLKAKAGAVLIEFSATELKADTACFPYLGFTRLTEETRAIQLGETGKYQLITLVGDEKDRTYLALTADCTELEKSSYEQTYTQVKTGYVSNDVPLFKFPCVNFSLPTVVTTLDKDKEISLHGELHLEQTYYLVSFEDGGVKQTGYLPSVYVSLFNGEPPKSENRVYGDTASDGDSVWRLWYILLGTAAVCILIDFLLLRKSAKEE